MKRIIINVLKIYHRCLSPFLPQSCRFIPTCSEYAITAIEKYGLIQGLGRSVVRISKCHPFHPGGYDPVTEL